MGYLAAHTGQLNKSVLEIVEYPKRKATMCSVLLLVLLLMFYTHNYFQLFGHLVTGTLSLFCALMMFVLVYLSTVDTLVINKDESTLSFQRIGILQREHRNFKLQLITNFKLVKQLKGNSIGDLKVYLLQASLISGADVTLFRSFDKKKIREHVGLPTHTVRPHHGVPQQEVQLTFTEVCPRHRTTQAQDSAYLRGQLLKMSRILQRDMASILNRA